ncbi:MAG: lipoprotein insertase outer membrane protein LolB [Thiobacillaceae bacterium]|nr:lipoprotein insertase outer membrane protein LolB [Thiobacillaceae bacterium]MCX7672970.1 lipoprotein insertase outer membrane protein LolB [Thiobacillaceae bacterium]MDW8324527.1 lipoprotein insertase outer membrane protein LolB [Burkholderiales bacterium]
MPLALSLRRCVGGRRARALALLLTVLVVGGCAPLRPPPPAATAQPAPLTNFRLEGRFSVKNAEQAYTGGIRWAHDAGQDEILLTAPTGQGLAQLRREPGGVVLTTAEGRSYTAPSAEELTEHVLGVRLPLEGLTYWLSGRPRPGAAHTLVRDAEGRVERLEQDGWRLEYGRYRFEAGRWLAGRLFARRGEELELRLVVDQWELP